MAQTSQYRLPETDVGILSRCQAYLANCLHSSREPQYRQMSQYMCQDLHGFFSFWIVDAGAPCDQWPRSTSLLSSPAACTAKPLRWAFVLFALGECVSWFQKSSIVLLHKFYVFPKWQTVGRQMHGLTVNLKYKYQFFHLLGSFILRATQRDTTVLLLTDCETPW